MSLLKRIQDTTLDQNCDVANLLRLCKVFAAQADAPDLTEWVAHELNGYTTDEGLPDYRRLRVTSRGHFSGPYGRNLRNADMPIQCLPKEYRETYRFAAIKESVGSLQATATNAKDTLILPWPTEAVQFFGSKMYEGMHCMQAWKILSAGALLGILDAVKTRVLDFTLALQKLHPELMTSINSDPALVSPKELRQTFNTTIYGAVGAIANASTNVAQHVTVSQGDKFSLDSELAAHGVSAEGIAALHDAMRSDTKDLKKPSGLGPKVKEWLGDAVLKVASGVWKTSLETAGKVFPALVAGYLGIELN